MDALTASLADKLEPAARDAWRARHQGGSSAADKVNKLFWWLAPQAVPFNSNLQGGVSLSFANPGVQAAAGRGNTCCENKCCNTQRFGKALRNARAGSHDADVLFCGLIPGALHLP